jgi:hypothetical protein
MYTILDINVADLWATMPSLEGVSVTCRMQMNKI